MPGLPVGVGTTVYVLWALAMPVVGLTRVMRGIEPLRWRVVAAQASVALGMVAGILVSIWLFSLLRVGAGYAGQPPALSLVRDLPVPAALVAVVVMILAGRAARRVRGRRSESKTLESVLLPSPPCRSRTSLQPVQRIPLSPTPGSSGLRDAVIVGQDSLEGRSSIRPAGDHRQGTQEIDLLWRRAHPVSGEPPQRETGSEEDR